MFALTGGKGGVGKTTTALGLAVAVARRGRSPVVLDADVDTPNLATAAGVPSTGVAAVARGAVVAEAGHSVDGATVLGLRTADGAATVRDALDALSGCDRPVFVDCPAGAGRVHGIALRAADRAVLVTRPTRRAVTDALKAAAMARELDAAPVGVLFNRAETHCGFDSVFDCQSLGAVPSVESLPVRTDNFERILPGLLYQIGQNV